MKETMRPGDRPSGAGPAGLGRGSPPEFQVCVRYRNPMRIQRVTPVQVQLQEYPRGRPFADVEDAPVLVKVSIPGAQVTPTEVRLDANQPGAEATFYATALARGSLRHANVQVLQGGRLLQEVPVPIKGSSQRLTWILLALTVLVPLALVYACRYNPLQGQVPIYPPNQRPTTPQNPTPPPPNPAGGGAGRGGAPGARGPAAPGPGGAQRQGQGARAGGRGNRQAGGNPRAGRGGPVPPPGEAGGTPPPAGQTAPVLIRRGEPGEVLSLRIDQNLYPIPHVTQAAPDHMYSPVATAFGTVYQLLCDLTARNFLACWVALALLVLTVLSWLAHLPIPGWRVSKPFGLTPASGETFSAKTLPLGGSEQPVTVEPVQD